MALARTGGMHQKGNRMGGRKGGMERAASAAMPEFLGSTALTGGLDLLRSNMVCVENSADPRLRAISFWP